MALQFLITCKEDILRCIRIIPEGSEQVLKGIEQILTRIKRQGLDHSFGRKISLWLNEAILAKTPEGVEKILLGTTIESYNSLVKLEFGISHTPSYLKAEDAIERTSRRQGVAPKPRCVPYPEQVRDTPTKVQNQGASGSVAQGAHCTSSKVRILLMFCHSSTCNGTTQISCRSSVLLDLAVRHMNLCSFSLQDNQPGRGGKRSVSKTKVERLDKRIKIIAEKVCSKDVYVLFSSGASAIGRTSSLLSAIADLCFYA